MGPLDASVALAPDELLAVFGDPEPVAVTPKTEKPIPNGGLHEVDGIPSKARRGSPKERRKPQVVCLADVEAKPVEWLWEPYIPATMITLLSGDPGVGKTALAMAIAAGLTTGKAVYTGAPMEPCNVVYLTQENSPEHVLRPRFDALGGDPKRFFFVTSGITLADTGSLSSFIMENSARLLVVDPLQSYFGSTPDAYRATETRPIMDGLIRLAQETRCAILITRHLAKSVGGVSALYRGLGSIDFTGAARCELLMGKDPENPERVIMAHVKTNLGKIGPSLAYSIADAGAVVWHGESRVTADDFLAAPITSAQRGALQRAVGWLEEALADGPQLSSLVEEQANAMGISIATLRRAKAKLSVKSKPDEFGGEWKLRLPSVAQKSPELLNTQA